MPLVTTGTELRYEMADFDACDEYSFKIHDTEVGLVLSSAFADDEHAGTVEFSPAAIDDGRTIAVLSQGSWLTSRLESPEREGEDEDEVTRLADDLPPFLLSRAALRELRAGSTRLRPEWGPSGGGEIKLTLRERTTAEVEHDGETHELEVLVAVGEGVELTVVDDDEWPVIVERVEGDNYWRLEWVASPREEGDEDEVLPPPEPAGPLAPTGPLDADAFVALAQRLGVAGLDMDYEGTRFSLMDDQRRAVIEARYKVVLVAMPGGTLRRAHTFPNYQPEQVLGPLPDDDPVELSGDLAAAASIAEDLARRAGADALYPDPLGAIYVALFDVRALV